MKNSARSREEFSDLILVIKEENNLSMPTRADEAEELFLQWLPSYTPFYSTWMLTIVVVSF